MQCRLSSHYVAASSQYTRRGWVWNHKPVDIQYRDASCIQTVSRLRRFRWRHCTVDIRDTNLEPTPNSKSPEYSQPIQNLLGYQAQNRKSGPWTGVWQSGMGYTTIHESPWGVEHVTQWPDQSLCRYWECHNGLARLWFVVPNDYIFVNLTSM